MVRHARQHAVERRKRALDVTGPEGQKPRGAQLAQHLELHVVKQRAARQGVEDLDRHRLFARLEAMDRLEQKTVRADGEMLQPRRREGARADLMSHEGLAREGVGIDEPVGRRPAAEPAPGTRPERAGEVRVGRQQVGRGARRRLGIGREQRRQECQVVLRLVDRVLGLLRRGPAETSARLGLGAEAELLEARELALRGPQRLEPVERGHARPRLLDVDAGVREEDARACRADRDAEREPLRRASGATRRQSRNTERLPLGVEQDGILDDLSWEELLGEARDEDDVETQTARGLRGGDEDGAVAAARRWHRQLAEPRAEDELHLVEVDRTDRRHRLELGEGGEYRVGTAQRGRGECAKLI